MLWDEHENHRIAMSTKLFFILLKFPFRKKIAIVRWRRLNQATVSPGTTDQMRKEKSGWQIAFQAHDTKVVHDFVTLRPKKSWKIAQTP